VVFAEERDGFVKRVRRVAAEQVAAGWLLSEDATVLVTQAEASDVLAGPREAVTQTDKSASTTT
jgi:hypothetical protein